MRRLAKLVALAAIFVCLPCHGEEQKLTVDEELAKIKIRMGRIIRQMKEIRDIVHVFAGAFSEGSVLHEALTNIDVSIEGILEEVATGGDATEATLQRVSNAVDTIDSSLMSFVGEEGYTFSQLLETSLEKMAKEATFPLHAWMKNSDLDRLLTRALRTAREDSPYEAAKLLAKLSEECPYSAAGMEAAATLRKWGLSREDLTEEKASEIDSAVRKILEEEELRTARLERALKFAQIGQYIKAIRELRDLAEGHPGTEQSHKAGYILIRWEAEALELDGLKDEDLEDSVGAASKAERILEKAHRYRGGGQLTKAHEAYRMVIERFPRTAQAADAENAIEKIKDSLPRMEIKLTGKTGKETVHGKGR